MTSVDAHTRADRDFHDATAHLYDSTLDPIFGAYQRTVVSRLLDELARSAPGREAVDIGCGTGTVTAALARRGFRVRGLDHSTAMMAKARSRIAREAPGAQVEFLEGDVRSLPFADGEVDLLTCQGVLHHLEDIPAAVAEFERVLAPGGVFYLADPCRGSNLALRAWQRMRTAWMKLRAGAPEAERDPGVEIPEHDEGPIDQQELAAALRDRGLDCRFEYWSRFEGLERMPAPAYAAALQLLTLPWRHRSGDMVFVTGSKSSTQRAGHRG